MEINSNNDSEDSNENKSNANDDSIVKKKDKLKRQIERLKSVILHAEWSLGISKFKDVEKIANPGQLESSAANIVPDVNTRLENELFRYAGFYCTKFSKHNYTFNFSPSNKCEKENQFAVQILNKDGKGILGKWIMPMSVDMDTLVSRIPIDNLQNVPSFLKSCKHHIDAYYSRSDQYKLLLRAVSQIRNSTVQSNLGYTHITLEVSGVHYIEDDVYLDLIIYLMYNSEESRPYKIEIDSESKQTMRDKVRKPLYASVKCFKSLDLNSAFDHILSESNGPFIWSKANDDSPLELNTLSNSDEDGFLQEFSLQEQSLTGHRRRRKIQRKQRVKREKVASKPMDTSNKGEGSNQQKKRKAERKTSKDISLRKSNTEITTNREKNIIDPMNTEETPLNITKHKLKQTKLRFNLAPEQESEEDVSKVSRNEFPAKVLRNRRNITPSTSTPLRKSLKLSISSNLDISDITVNENNLKEAEPQNCDTAPTKKIKLNASSPMRTKKQVTKKGKQK